MVADQPHPGADPGAVPLRTPTAGAGAEAIAARVETAFARFSVTDPRDDMALRVIATAR